MENNSTSEENLAQVETALQEATLAVRNAETMEGLHGALLRMEILLTKRKALRSL